MWKLDAELSVLWLKFPGKAFGVDGCVFLGVVYVPPQGSHRVQVQSQQQRLAELASQASGAGRMGHVLLCGDFNAHVSGDGAEGLTPGGTSLLDFCEACDLSLLTGKLEGDIPAMPSFAARVHTGSSRPDHVIVSQGLLSRMQSLHVDASRHDSDHYPLRLVFQNCVVPQPAVIPGALHTYPRLRWNGECCDDYQSRLLGDQCTTGMRSVMGHLASGDSASAAGLMRETLMSTAKLAGMRAAGQAGQVRCMPFWACAQAVV